LSTNLTKLFGPATIKRHHETRGQDARTDYWNYGMDAFELAQYKQTKAIMNAALAEAACPEPADFS